MDAGRQKDPTTVADLVNHTLFQIVSSKLDFYQGVNKRERMLYSILLCSKNVQVHFVCKQNVWAFKKIVERGWMPYVFGILTLGTFNLIIHWKPELRLRILYRPCLLPAAEKLLVQVLLFTYRNENMFLVCPKRRVTRSVAIANCHLALNTIAFGF